MLMMDNQFAVRMARVVMTMDLFQVLFSGSYFRLIRGLPADAKLHQVCLDPATNCINLYYKSEEFAPVQVGEILPQIYLTFEIERVNTTLVGVDYSEAWDSNGSCLPEHPG